MWPKLRQRKEAIAVLWLLLWAVWLIANASWSVEIVLIGGLLSLLVALIFTLQSDSWRSINLKPQGIYHFIAYTAVFLRELVLANINVMRLVFSPRIDIQPGVIRIDTKLRSPIGRLALANSISLTPGSLVLDVENDTLVVHWLDLQTLNREEASQIIAGPYENHLEQVFG
jgi:multicomponent Na+:H+ antiporter subunit E